MPHSRHQHPPPRVTQNQVWGGDGDIEAVGAVGTVVVDPFVGPNPVNSVSGTGAVGTLIFDQNISFATHLRNLHE